MKTIKLLACLLFTSMAMISCGGGEEEESSGSDEYNIVDFEDTTGSYWSSLVDSKQNGGSLLYSGKGYTWRDSKTTLSGGLTDVNGDGTFSTGGIVLSNYYDDNLRQHNTVDYQLAVPKSYAGKNFLIVKCNPNPKAPASQQACLTFDKPTAVTQLMISPTTYTLGTCLYGKNALQDGQELYIHIVAYNGMTKVGDGYKTLYNTDGLYLDKWDWLNVSSFGKLTKLIFYMGGSDVEKEGDHKGYLKTPAYFAIDNIVCLK